MARSTALETEAAREMPGVRLVLTAADLAGIGPLAARARIEGMVEPRRPVLAEGRVLHVGQPVAAVVAEHRGGALDALEAIGLEIAERPAVIDVEAAAEARRDLARGAGQPRLCLGDRQRRGDRPPDRRRRASGAS